MTVDIVTGSTSDHLVALEQAADHKVEQYIHRQVMKPLLDLQQAASKAGFDLKICSAFRSFERQLIIWNGKASGSRSVMDELGQPIDIASLDAWQKIQAIMRWSALPAASRHHWGTDFDVYDAKAMPEDYQIQLTPDEVKGTGLFTPMHDWLDQYIQSGNTEFYRPYEFDTGGIAPERWHLSYRPLADQYTALQTIDVIAQRLQQSKILLLDTVIEHLDEIYNRFILVD
jgi:LAS superfamily LD-carboxypeptidase LdcB